MKLLFVEAMAPGQLYRASPMSLLYALAPLFDLIEQGRVDGITPADLVVRQPASIAEFMQSFREHRPSIVGMSVTTYGIRFAREAARLCKQLDPDVQVIVGGSHFDGLYGHYEGCEQALGPEVDPAIDVVLSGEAEQPLATLIAFAASARAVLRDIIRSNGAALSEIDARFALWVTDERGGLQIIRPRAGGGGGGESGQRRPAAARPPRNLLPLECELQFSIFQDRDAHRLRTAQVLTYRGCFFAANPKNACSFCFVANTYTRFDLEHTLSELRVLRDAGYRALFFDDGVFTSRSAARKAELREIVRVLRELEFDALGFQTRADYIDPEVLQILSAAGSRWYCSLGLESTDETILKLIGKKQTVEDVTAAIKLLTQFEFDIGLYLMFGALGSASNGCRTPETLSTAERTIDFVARQRDSRAPIGCALPGVSMILPGTADARRYQASTANADNPLRFDICHEGDPWRRFEGGLGMHAPGVTAELLEHIDLYGHDRLGPLWTGSANG